MRHKLIVGLAGLILLAGSTMAQAEGDPAKGKLLFTSPSLGGGKSGKSCQSCHAEGKNLAADLFAPGRPPFKMGGKTRKNLAAVVNYCIENALAGQAIDPNGEEMANLLAYLKTLTTEKIAKKNRTKMANRP